MTPLTQFLAAVAVVLAAGVTGWWTRQRGRDADKASPYAEMVKRLEGLEERDEAKTARIDSLQEQVWTLREEVHSRDSVIAEQGRKIAGLELRDSIWQTWILDLSRRWTVLRQEPTSPPGPDLPPL